MFIVMFTLIFDYGQQTQLGVYLDECCVFQSSHHRFSLQDTRKHDDLFQAASKCPISGLVVMHTEAVELYELLMECMSTFITKWFNIIF